VNIASAPNPTHCHGRLGADSSPAAVLLRTVRRRLGAGVGEGIRGVPPA
jgi:hypothetical protein